MSQETTPGAGPEGRSEREGDRLHTRNRGFAWATRPGPWRRIDAEQARCWDEQGWFLLRDAFTPGEIAAVVAEIDPIEAKVAGVLRSHPERKIFIAEDGNITFSTHLVLRSERLRRFCAHPVFQDLCHDLVGDDVRLYWDQAVYKHHERPGSFPWHQDNGYTFISPQQYLTCWLALTDATPENGCPEVAPGLHREGTLAHELTELGFRCLPDDHPGVAAPLRAGSMAVFSSLTPHRTGPNRSGGVRKAYIVQFAPDGAHHVSPDGERTLPAAAPERQFPILVGGRPPAH